MAFRAISCGKKTGTSLVALGEMEHTLLQAAGEVPYLSARPRSGWGDRPSGRRGFARAPFTGRPDRWRAILRRIREERAGLPKCREDRFCSVSPPAPGKVLSENAMDRARRNALRSTGPLGRDVPHQKLMTDPIDPVPAREPVARLVAPGVERLAVLFTNAYLVGATDAPQGPWVMVDAGLPGLADRILRAALARRGRPPEAIVLTHGHSDH